MQIAFVSNYINHHQIPVSDRLYELSGHNYTFVQTEVMEEERAKMGWDPKSVNKPYVKLYYEEKDVCDKLIMDSDCVIFGGCEDESIIMPRLEKGLFTVRYSESIYKEGRWKFVSPRGLKKKYHDHIRFRKNPVFLLCSGAHVKGDFKLIGAYPGKKLKYGYFPKTVTYEDVHSLRKNNCKTEILWASRFIGWKHPEIMVGLADNLKARGLDFHITMIGSGELLEKTREDIRRLQLDDYISIKGNMSPDEVRTYMLGADIFVQTSDRREGWGAVINEAMNSGCVTIAARQIGAAPYLIKNGENGFLYNACDLKTLSDIVLRVSQDRNKAKSIGNKAYETILTTWNADVAATRLYKFICDEQHKIPDYENGPLSEA